MIREKYFVTKGVSVKSTNIQNCKLITSNYIKPQSEHQKAVKKFAKKMNSSTRSIESFKVLATQRKNRLNSKSCLSPKNDSVAITNILDSKEDYRSQTIEEVIKNLNADS